MNFDLGLLIIIRGGILRKIFGSVGCHLGQPLWSKLVMMLVTDVLDGDSYLIVRQDYLPYTTLRSHMLLEQ